MKTRGRVALLAIGAILLISPFISRAMGTEADAMCVPADPDPCICSPKFVPKKGCVGAPNKFMCPCSDSTNGFTTSGKCVSTFKCQAEGTSDGKGPDAGLSKLGEILGKLMESLKGGGGGGGGGGESGDASSSFGLNSQICTTMQPVDASSSGTNSACTYGGSSGSSFNAFDTWSASQQSSGGLNVRVNAATFTASDTPSVETHATTGGTNSLADLAGIHNAAFTGNGLSNIGKVLFTTPLTNLNNSGSVSTGGSAGNYSTGSSASTGGTNDGVGAALNFNTPQSIVQSIIQKNVPAGPYGDVKILDNGTTIIVAARDGNAGVSGFYGANSARNASGRFGTVTRLCSTRPWASNVLAYIIPASFFDSLCTGRGYVIGTAKTQPDAAVISQFDKTGNQKTVNIQRTATQKPVAATSSAPTAVVDIWASPPTVPLGARTSIFWNTQGVTDCIETSADGSFTHASLKGGASTVPLTQSTTYTISCVASNGVHLNNHVTVLMAP